MRARVGAIAATTALLATLFVPGTSAAAPCYETGGYTKVTKTPAHPNGDVNTVDVGKFNQYTRTFGGGQHHVVVQSPADVDLKVCRVSGGTGTMICESGNVAPMADGCLIQDSPLQGSNPGMGATFSGAGTYWIQVLHCTNLGCGYPADVPSLPYVITWFTV